MAKKVMAMFLVLVFSGVYGSGTVAAQSSAVIGKIQTLTAKGSDQYDLVIVSDSGEVTFRIDPSTMIQVPAEAKNLKEGAIVVPVTRSGGGGGGGFKMPKLPFQDMSAKEKKMLGLPDLGKLPEIPNVGDLTKMPKLPEIPKMPEIPKAPKSPLGGGGGGMGAGAPPEMAAGGPPEGAAPPKKSEIPEAVEPEDDSLQKMIPKTLGAATPGEGAPEAPAAKPLKVTAVKMDGEKVSIELENAEGKRESISAAPDELFFQIADPKQLEEGMSVEVEIRESPNGMRAVSVRVLPAAR